jgi:catechol 2,3-dioxygenase-like lactoylglutathione lyase family enzyme
MAFGPSASPHGADDNAGGALSVAAGSAYPLVPGEGHDTGEEVVTVFEDARGVAVIAALDLERARSFYVDVLGLTVEDDMPEQEMVFFRLAGVPLMVYRSGYAGTAKSTVFALETGNLARDMSLLRERGVTFLDYDFPGLKTVDGVAELGGQKAAWFEDSEGNILSLSERV